MSIFGNTVTARQTLRPFNLCYLATPYSKYRLGIDQAFQHAAALAAELLLGNVRVYSPICHSHPIAEYGGLDHLNHAIWLPFEERMMRVCDCLIVAHLEGWEESHGIAHEIGFFEAARKPVFDLDPDTFALTLRGGPRA